MDGTDIVQRPIAPAHFVYRFNFPTGHLWYHPHPTRRCSSSASLRRLIVHGPDEPRLAGSMSWSDPELAAMGIKPPGWWIDRKLPGRSTRSSIAARARVRSPPGRSSAGTRQRRERALRAAVDRRPPFRISARRRVITARSRDEFMWRPPTVRSRRGPSKEADAGGRSLNPAVLSRSPNASASRPFGRTGAPSRAVVPDTLRRSSPGDRPSPDARGPPRFRLSANTAYFPQQGAAPRGESCRGGELQVGDLVTGPSTPVPPAASLPVSSHASRRSFFV